MGEMVRVKIGTSVGEGVVMRGGVVRGRFVVSVVSVFGVVEVVGVGEMEVGVVVAVKCSIAMPCAGHSCRAMAWAGHGCRDRARRGRFLLLMPVLVIWI